MWQPIKPKACCCVFLSGSFLLRSVEKVNENKHKNRVEGHFILRSHKQQAYALNN